MLIKHETVHGSWTRSPVFVMASLGAVIGLANFWRFPYAMAEHGGLWFLLAYVLFLLLFGLPLLYAEMLLGRVSRSSPLTGVRTLVKASGLRERWHWAGTLGPIAGLLSLAVYVIVAGFCLAYLFKSALGTFNGVLPNDALAIWSSLSSQQNNLFAWEVLFLLGLFVMLARGVNKGIERTVRYLIPLFFLLMTLLTVHAWRQGDWRTALDYLFLDGRSAFDWWALAYAAQHAFFTLAIGMGGMMAFGAYSPGRRGLLAGVSWIIGLDLVVSVLAGIMIFPLVFSAGFGPAQGFDLLFLVMPMTYGQLPNGQFWAALFFALMVFAAWAAAVALCEPWVAWLVERFRWRRWLASLATIVLVAVLAFALSLSFGGGEIVLGGFTLFGLYNLVVSSLLIPGAALLIVLLVGWVLPQAQVRQLVEAIDARWFYLVWRFLLRFVAPGLLCLLIPFTVASLVGPLCSQTDSEPWLLCGWLAPAGDASIPEPAVLSEAQPAFDNEQLFEEIDDQDH